ncbi:MAG TPA: LytTR family DNA-binding domain-containing protein [Allosphingosinicella sp.]|nr:LytTR family DNA-binding domain-containing protein [Allosphingosinicella sp.]
MTNGGWAGTSGGGRRLLLPWLAVAALASVNVAVNASSVAADRAQLGQPVAAWKPWVWEGTSALSWLVLAPLVFLLILRLRPPRIPLAAAAAVHLLATVPASLAHVGLMIGLRKLAYAAAGLVYETDSPLSGMLLYEYRKDFATYALLAAFFLLFERVAGSPERAGPDADPGYRIEVRDGSRTRWLAPEQVEWAQSAGNYVELHGAFGTLLHRQTLASLEARLAPFGFVRVHRSRLVRAAAVTAVETRPSGDFEIVLAGGLRLAGSRRYRDRL